MKRMLLWYCKRGWKQNLVGALIGILLGVIIALWFPFHSWAGEKEELQLQRLVILERMEKLKAQSQVLAIQFEAAKIDLQNIEAKLTPILEKEKKVDPPPPPGKK